MKTRIYTFNNSTLKVIFGNILESKSEVIVSSDDNRITMGGGVSYAILKSGGGIIQRDAQKKLPAKLGDVVVSTAGNLDYQKYIFHSITIDLDSVNRWRMPKEEYFRSLCQKMNIPETDLCKFIVRQTVHKCFQLVDVLNLSSIAFPTIGAGAARLNIAEVAENMADEISECLKKTNRKIDVELYLYDRYNNTDFETYIDMFEAFAVRQAFIEHELRKPASLGEEVADNRPQGIASVKQDEMNHLVFISYSRKDIAKAQKIRQFLSDAGISCWMDVEGYYSGQDYIPIIVQAIKCCKLMLFLSSENSNQSINVYRELREALYRNKTVLPLKLDNAPYSDCIAFDLRDCDYIEYKEDTSVFEKLRQNICLRIGTEK